MFYISERWPGGLLTNFNTVKKSIQRFIDLENMNETGIWEAETKKEILELTRELAKKRKMLSGIKDMTKLPDAIFVIDPKKEAIAVKEAKILNIPIYAVVDTNCNPDDINYPIPGNDDAIRAIGVFLDAMANAINEGVSMQEIELDAEEKQEDLSEETSEQETTITDQTKDENRQDAGSETTPEQTSDSYKTNYEDLEDEYNDNY